MQVREVRVGYIFLLILYLAATVRLRPKQRTYNCNNYLLLQKHLKSSNWFENISNHHCISFGFSSFDKIDDKSYHLHSPLSSPKYIVPLLLTLLAIIVSIGRHSGNLEHLTFFLPCKTYPTLKYIFHAEYSTFIL